MEVHDPADVPRLGTLLPPTQPRRRRSLKRVRPSIGMLAPGGGDPTMTQVPPGRVAANAWAINSGSPTTSNA